MLVMLLTPKALRRFWAKVKKCDGDGCWEWQAGLSKLGYGRFRLGKNKEPAHRVSWTIHKGEIPDGLHVLHTCDNRKCVRPDHFFLGTMQDNTRDMVMKNRQAFGDRSARKKWSDEQVAQLKKMKIDGLNSFEASEKTGIPSQTIRHIWLGRVGKHVSVSGFSTEHNPRGRGFARR